MDQLTTRGAFWGLNVTRGAGRCIDPVPKSFHVVKAMLRKPTYSDQPITITLLVMVGDDLENEIALCRFTDGPEGSSSSEYTLDVTFVKGQKVTFRLENNGAGYNTSSVDLSGFYLNDKEEARPQLALQQEGLVTKPDLDAYMEKMTDAITALFTTKMDAGMVKMADEMLTLVTKSLDANTEKMADEMRKLDTKRDLEANMEKIVDQIHNLPDNEKYLNTINESLGELKVQQQEILRKLQQQSSNFKPTLCTNKTTNETPSSGNDVDGVAGQLEKLRDQNQLEENASTQTELERLLANMEDDIIPKLQEIVNDRNDDTAKTFGGVVEQSLRIIKDQSEEHLEELLANAEGTCVQLKNMIDLRHNMNKLVDNSEELRIQLLPEESGRARQELGKLLTNMETVVSKVKSANSNEKRETAESLEKCNEEKRPRLWKNPKSNVCGGRK